MPPFPPIFAYVIFGFVWLLEVICTIFVVTIPVAMVISILDDILLVMWLWLRLGPGMFGKLKGKDGDKKMLKRFLIQCAGELIPVADLFPWNIWFVYKVYQDELAEYRGKVTKLKSENEETLLENKEVRQNDIQAKEEMEIEEIQEEREMEAEERSERKEEKDNSNPWMKTKNKSTKPSEENNKNNQNSSNNKNSDIKKEDLPAELRLREQLENPESLSENFDNYSNFDTYEKKDKLNTENKKKDIQKRVVEEKQKIIKVNHQKENVEKNKINESERRYGSSAGLVVRMKDGFKSKDKNKDKDKEGEIIGFKNEDKEKYNKAA